MRWKSGRRSSNIEDRRGIRLSPRVKGGGVGILLLVIVAMYFNVDPSIVIQQGTEMGGGSSIQTIPVEPSAADNKLADFVSVVLADSFTHGTSAQRVTWFNSGFQTGNIKTCNTFKAQDL